MSGRAESFAPPASQRMLSSHRLRRTAQAVFKAHSILCLALAALSATLASCTRTSLTAPGQSLNKCAVTLTVPESPIVGGGGNGSVGIAATAECAWTASTDAAWITDLTPARGQGA